MCCGKCSGGVVWRVWWSVRGSGALGVVVDMCGSVEMFGGVYVWVHF